MFASEWRADSQALASDGQYWRSVYGGARLVLGCIRVTPAAFCFMRLLLTVLAGFIFFFEVYRVPVDSTFFLYFHHDVYLLQLVYFVLASCLTIVSVCTAGSGGIARTTPFYVRITELAYGALYPAAWVNAFMLFGILYVKRSHCVSAADETNHLHSAIQGGVGLAILLIDSGFNRQPYYASFHAIVGILFCWAWLLFSALWELGLGGRDAFGHGYIYRCLDWSYPIIGGRFNAEGKLMYLNFFVTIPAANYVYWLLIWARRRTLTIYKSQNSLNQPLTQAPRPPTARRVLFEYGADYRDLALDGRHWRAQFGGSSSPKMPKMGAYICCGPTLYPIFRLLLAAFAVGVFSVRVWEYSSLGDQWWRMMLYFDNWVFGLSALYFSLAFVLTLFATCTPGAESNSTPLLVWIVWAAYGALLPCALLSSLMFLMVTTRYTFLGLSTVVGSDVNRIVDLSSQYGTALVVLLDAWINRQPYYATYHGFVGCLATWGYLLFNVAWVLTGGLNENGLPYIYRAWNWLTPSLERQVTPGAVTLLELFAFLPLFNALYWCMLWARRRARVAAKQSAV